MAESIHAYVMCKCDYYHVCAGNGIITLYAKCANMEKACLVFNFMEERDGISWNSMLSADTQNGLGSEALLLFDQVLASGAKLNPVTALIMVSACAYLESQQHGRRLPKLITDGNMGGDFTNL